MKNKTEMNFGQAMFMLVATIILIGVGAISGFTILRGDIQRAEIDGQAVEVYVFDEGYEPIAYAYQYDTWMCRDPYERIINCTPFYTVEYQPAHLDE